MNDHSANDRLRQIFEWDQTGALDPYADVDLRRGLSFSIPVTHLRFRPVPGLQTEYLVLPATRVAAALISALAALTMATSLPIWAVLVAVLIAAPVGFATAALLQGMMTWCHFRQRRSLTASDVLAAADRALKEPHLRRCAPKRPM